MPPGTAAPLDPGFRPPILAWRRYGEEARRSSSPRRAQLALERQGGLISRLDVDLLPEGDREEDTARLVERAFKFLLWSRGGWRLWWSGPEDIARRLESAYAPGGERGFDEDLIARRVYGRPFELVRVAPDEVPPERGSTSRIGGHLDGCRIGIDLGASDFKLAAVKDGEPVFTTEIPWDPSRATDISYHYERITDGLRLAASHLPRVDAIGGSSAGIWIDNQVLVASLFRGLSPDDFERHAKGLFLRIRDEWRVPLEVANDGDVTALAGGMSLDVRGVLGIAMGSSEAAGFLDGDGAITGWLNELAFAPFDFAPDSIADEWSKDRGVGAMGFSQQAVNKLLPAAGIETPSDLPLPERLKVAQMLADDGDPRAAAIFKTIGVYLGYTIPWYAEFYRFEHLLILGRVTSGRGGEMILETASEILDREFPEVASRVRLHVPDEASRRVGQAVAAASLPEIVVQ
ncbi:MAG TPA: ROK family protein [Planctomycetota bacterium]|nr:ROK family protein [Planctomycetota bacterium]